jgi:hypothetical protein
LSTQVTLEQDEVYEEHRKNRQPYEIAFHKWLVYELKMTQYPLPEQKIEAGTQHSQQSGQRETPGKEQLSLPDIICELMDVNDEGVIDAEQQKLGYSNGIVGEVAYETIFLPRNEFDRQCHNNGTQQSTGNRNDGIFGRLSEYYSHVCGCNR